MQITEILHTRAGGDRGALNAVIPLVYDELKRLARAHLRREENANTIQTTALVHEAFLKLAGSRQPAYENRAHFYGIFSRLMRQLLVDMARSRSAEKRGNGEDVTLTDLPDWGRQSDKSLLAMDEALQRLHDMHPLKSQLIEMRYFGGMTAEESASALAIPPHRVRRELRLGQAWLQREMAGG